MKQSFFMPSMILSVFLHGIFIATGGGLPVAPQVSVLEAPNSLEITVIRQPVVSVLENEIIVAEVVDRVFLDDKIVFNPLGKDIADLGLKAASSHRRRRFSRESGLKDISKKPFYQDLSREKSPDALTKTGSLSHEDPARHYPFVSGQKLQRAVSETGSSSDVNLLPEDLSVSSQELRGAVTEAKPLFHVNPAPDYPALARERGWEGVVRLDVLVAQDGTPAQVSVRQGSGHKILDKAAVKAVEDWKFAPAQSGSLKFVSRVIIPIQFSLINQ